MKQIMKVTNGDLSKEYATNMGVYIAKTVNVCSKLPRGLSRIL